MTESAQDQLGPWAHNTDRSGPDQDVPVVWTGDDPPSDIEHWHVASDEELTAYDNYWQAKADAEDNAEFERLRRTDTSGGDE